MIILASTFCCVIGMNLAFHLLGMQMGFTNPSAHEFTPHVKRCENRLVVTNLLSQGLFAKMFGFDAVCPIPFRSRFE